MDSLCCATAGYIRPQKSANPTRRTVRGLFMFPAVYMCDCVCVRVCEWVCVWVCIFYMHSTSFTIFGHRAASSSLVPAMSVHISHSALRTAPCHTPHTPAHHPLPYSAVVTHAQRQFRFQFRMLSMRKGSKKRKKEKKRNTKEKQAKVVGKV